VFAAEYELAAHRTIQIFTWQECKAKLCTCENVLRMMKSLWNLLIQFFFAPCFSGATTKKTRKIRESSLEEFYVFFLHSASNRKDMESNLYL
jgi:hypothetical protein